MIIIDIFSILINRVYILGSETVFSPVIHTVAGAAAAAAVAAAGVAAAYPKSL